MPPSRRREKLCNRVASCPASRSDGEQGLWLKRATSNRLGEGQLATLRGSPDGSERQILIARCQPNFGFQQRRSSADAPQRTPRLLRDFRTQEAAAAGGRAAGGL